MTGYNHAHVDYNHASVWRKAAMGISSDYHFFILYVCKFQCSVFALLIQKIIRNWMKTLTC